MSYQNTKPFTPCDKTQWINKKKSPLSSSHWFHVDTMNRIWKTIEKNDKKNEKKDQKMNKKMNEKENTAPTM